MEEIGVVSFARKKEIHSNFPDKNITLSQQVLQCKHVKQEKEHTQDWRGRKTDPWWPAGYHLAHLEKKGSVFRTKRHFVASR